MPEIHKGVEGIYIDRSSISRVFGEKGKLTYRGYWIEDLAHKASYEEVTYLLLYGKLPNREELESFEEKLKNYRELDSATKNLIGNMTEKAPMDVLRTAVSSLTDVEEYTEFDIEENKEDGVKIIAKVPTIIAYFDRIRQGKKAVEPNRDFSHAENFLYMLHGEAPTEKEVKAMDAALILYAEHGMNASTFASITTASTLANIYSAITSGIGALQGPLHGGATETVVEMLDEIGSKDKVEDFVDRKLESHEKIPGFGHRVYKALDPRCAVFEEYYRQLSEERGDRERLEMIKKLHEKVVSELGDKGIYPNGDLYSGTVYSALGIKRDLFTCMFAMARVAGWTAHVFEQWEDNRIVRPRVEYTGETDLEFPEIEGRS
ncbi:MAG: citrate/2-methylcitrate synthase, partial [Candidatus Nanohaloarchaea archaeon]|nr:citrate/2-methylcitrate synthase [Candidatus Nanohaloarchaea archaeon]